jgi:ribosomal protein S18 acetylase RimI-like enzyme
MPMSYRDTREGDFTRSVEIRGMTGDNEISAEVLEELGVTEETWVPLIRDGSIVGVVAESNDVVIGFCSGDTESGEVLVLALLPEYEGQGIGTKMLALVSEKLFALGYERLWLAASADSEIRAHGFYRHLGWIPTGDLDVHGDEVLEFCRL